jgi:phosphohistidine phosphatase
MKFRMPRTLYLLRHADSLEKKINQSDKDRELSPRGRQQCEVVCECFREKKFRADLICSSSAMRTRSTSEIVAACIGIDNQHIQYSDLLYEASVKNFCDVVAALGDEYTSVICVGHNPGISSFAEYLTGRYIGSMDTAGLAMMEFDISGWSQLSGSTATSFRYFDPTTIKLQK